jgi:predicted Zn-dependent protease with MMP-like domain
VAGRHGPRRVRVTHRDVDPRRRRLRERLALTEWGEVAALFLLLAFVVSVPLLYSAAHGVDVERPWVVAVVAVLVPVLLVAAWLLSEHFWNVADALEARRRRAEQAVPAFGLHDPTAWCGPELFADVVDRALARLPAEFASGLEERHVGITTAEFDPEWPRALGLYQTGGGITKITLFRVNLVRSAGSLEQLEDAVADTLLHEVGHAFGMTEDDLNRYTIGNQPAGDAIRVRRLSELELPDPGSG